MRLREVLIVFAILFAVGCAWWFASQRTSPDADSTTPQLSTSENEVHTAVADHDEMSVNNRPIEVSNKGFVASDKCKECHAEHYESWHASYHRRMTQVASTESVIGKFDETQSVQAYGREFVLSKRGDEYWVRMDPLGTPDNQESGEKIDRRIVMTTGSHHMQIYWYSVEPDKKVDEESGDSVNATPDRTLFQLPVAWLNETESWVPTSSLFISPPPQPLRIGERRWNEVCIKCHTTNGQPRVTNANDQVHVDTQVAEFGISCEACHGPGETHVALHSTEGKSGTTDLVRARIVHPAKLDHKRSSQVCGQCHGNWLPNSKDGLSDYYINGTCFRAGDDLSERRHIFAAKQPRSEFIKTFLSSEPHYFEDRYWKDGAIRVSGGEYNGMTNSPCFPASDMSCLSCHQMHQSEDDERDQDSWANDQLKIKALGQQACLQCHEDLRSDEAQTAHSRHSIGSSGNECYNCHMPHTSYGLLKAIRSHRVSSPSVQESIEIKRPNACNQCHIDKTLAWTADHLKERYGIAPPEQLTEDQRKYSATVLWSLTGDAGQRSLAAWTLGWAPALEASRTDWVGAVLAQLLADPYDAVRHIAHRSLRKQPGFADFEFEYPAPAKQNQQGAVRAFQTWHKLTRRTSLDPTELRAVLLAPNGQLNSKEFSRLNHLRDNRQVLLAE